MVSSNLRFANEPAEVLIDTSTPAGAQSGLTRASVVKCENLYTLPQSCVLRKIGRLTGPLVQQLDAALKASLELP